MSRGRGLSQLYFTFVSPSFQYSRDGGGAGVGEEGGRGEGDGKAVFGEEQHDLLHH